MNRPGFYLGMVGLALLLTGCGTYPRPGVEPSRGAAIETELRQQAQPLPRELEDRILALNSLGVSDRDIRDVLASVPGAQDHPDPRRCLAGDSPHGVVRRFPDWHGLSGAQHRQPGRRNLHVQLLRECPDRRWLRRLVLREGRLAADDAGSQPGRIPGGQGAAKAGAGSQAPDRGVESRDVEGGRPF